MESWLCGWAGSGQGSGATAGVQAGVKGFAWGSRAGGKPGLGIRPEGLGREGRKWLVACLEPLQGRTGRRGLRLGWGPEPCFGRTTPEKPSASQVEHLLGRAAG